MANSDIKSLIHKLIPNMRSRTKRSVESAGKHLRSWPQLASVIALGAANVTTAACRILLGDSLPSGRYYADIEDQLTEDQLTRVESSV